MQAFLRRFLGLVATLAALAPPAFAATDTATGASSPPPLAARYSQTTTRHDGRLMSESIWYLYRDADRVVTADADGRTLEIWTRTADGRVALRRVFHQWHRIVDYTPEELDSRNAEPHWEALSSMLTADVRARFETAGTTASFGEQALQLQRRRDEQVTSIVWLPQAALPARIEQSGDRYTTVLSLLALAEQPAPGWPSVSETAWAGYQPIDATDFGDMDTDPFVQEVERIDAAAGTLGRLGHLHVVD